MAKIRVAHIFPQNFGAAFNGRAHVEFSLLSGWHDADISLDLLGTHLKVKNLNSGMRDYELTGNLNTQIHNTTRWTQLTWTFKVLWLLITQMHHFDIFQFTLINWGGLLSPFLLHPFGKKVIFSMIRFGNDNPGAITVSRNGKIALDCLRHFDGMIGLAPAFVEDCNLFNFKNKLLALPNFMAIPQLDAGKDIAHGAALRSQLGISQDAQVILYVGVAHKRKGLDVLINSYVELSKRYPNLWLIIVGPRGIGDYPYPDQDFIPEQKNKLFQSGIENRVVWTGMISDPGELARHYSAADLFVLPTRSEGLGNVLIEALFAELPVVVSHLPGITDIVIKHRENGFLVAVDDTPGFIDSIDALVRNPALRQSMGQNGHRGAVESFGFDRYCQKLKDFYFEILGN
jgi:glycosyltransferase involved in cell wall biosynthesis